MGIQDTRVQLNNWSYLIRTWHMYGTRIIHIASYIVYIFVCLTISERLQGTQN